MSVAKGVSLTGQESLNGLSVVMTPGWEDKVVHVVLLDVHRHQGTLHQASLRRCLPL